MLQVNGKGFASLLQSFLCCSVFLTFSVFIPKAEDKKFQFVGKENDENCNEGMREERSGGPPQGPCWHREGVAAVGLARSLTTPRKLSINC